MTATSAYMVADQRADNVQQYFDESSDLFVAVSTKNPNPVRGSGYTAQTTITRPDNTTAYAAGDVVGGVIEFANVGPAGGHIIVTDTDLMIFVASIPSGMSNFRLHLYSATPPSALADNAAWDLPAGDRASYLGYIDLGSPVDVGSTLFVSASAVNKKLMMGASTSLFGYLVTGTAYPPSALAVKSVRLNSVGV